MDAGGGKAKDDVAFGNRLPGQQVGTADGADREAGQVIVAGGIKAGQFGGFAAH